MLGFCLIPVLEQRENEWNSSLHNYPSLPWRTSNTASPVFEKRLMSNRTMGHKMSPYLQLYHCLCACCFEVGALPVKLFLSSPGCWPPLVTSPPAAGAGYWLYTHIFPVSFAKALHNAVGTWPASCEEWIQKLWMSHSHSPWKENPKTPSYPIHITHRLLQWLINLDFIGSIEVFPIIENVKPERKKIS